MAKKLHDLPIIFKILLAFAIFSSILITLNKFFSKNIISKDKENPLTQSQEQTLFYKTIGQYKSPQKNNQHIKLENQYTLEFDIQNSQKEALELIDHLAKKGVTAYYTPLQKNGKVIYRVRKGVFANMKEAKSIAQKMKNKQKISSKVIKLKIKQI